MALFAVIAHAGAPRLSEAVKARYSEKHFFRAPNCWFVEDDATTEVVAARLEIQNGELEGVQAVVLPVSNYAGWVPKTLWEWLGSRVRGIF